MVMFPPFHSELVTAKVDLIKSISQFATVVPAADYSKTVAATQTWVCSQGHSHDSHGGWKGEWNRRRGVEGGGLSISGTKSIGGRII